MQLGEWVPFDPDFIRNNPDFYYGYQDCFELRIKGIDKPFPLRNNWDFVVGNRKSRFVLMGIAFEMRQTKEWKGRPKPKEPDPHTYEEVSISRFNATGDELLEFVKEHRAVYSNTKGRYIKTRADGRVYLTFDNPPRVHFKGRKAVPPKS